MFSNNFMWLIATRFSALDWAFDGKLRDQMILKVSSLSHLQTMVPLVTHSWQM
jgi:hypothetical protein